MYLVAIAWLYVVLMMALAEATSSQGTVLGALFTLLLYGVLPLSIVMYLLGTPMRRRARRAREAQEMAEANAAAGVPAAAEEKTTADATSGPSAPSAQPGGGGQAAGDTVAPVRKEP